MRGDKKMMTVGKGSKQLAAGRIFLISARQVWCESTGAVRLSCTTESEFFSFLRVKSGMYHRCNSSQLFMFLRFDISSCPPSLATPSGIFL